MRLEYFILIFQEEQKMFKKIAALILAVLMVASLAVVFTSCRKEAEETVGAFGFDKTFDLAESGVVRYTGADVAEGTAVENFKVGVILIGDESEGYSEAHINGILKAINALGLDADTQVIWKKKVDETENCYNAAKELVAAGCQLVISNSYGHQDYTKQAASEFPQVQFVAMTGDTAAASGLDNFSNAFTSVYESRYLAGVVAGMKLAELVADGKVADANKDENGNIKLGYVGAFNYAEVVSGYTAFYLGVKSVVDNVVMDVQYTNSWFDWDGEYTTAKALMDNGCIIIGQHADSTGAPTAVQEYLTAGKTVYSVGYNIDMLGVAPEAALTSAANNWAAYYEYAIKTALYGGDIATNWTGGYAENAVLISELGKSCAAGTAEKVAEVQASLTDGSLKVFDTSKYTVGGKTVSYAFASDTDGDWANDANNAIADGFFHESYVQSAPAFSIRIDGITELN